tara:strand:- start:851 stop:1618 length:768 start_codon:yes stop_codon:yes gene_type:complete
MLESKYVTLITELLSLKEIIKEMESDMKQSDHDMRWYLSELFKRISITDEEKFIKISGMQGHLTTTAKKKELQKYQNKTIDNQFNIDDDLNQSENKSNKKTVNKKWAKDLYRKSVKRCHPDLVKHADADYKEELTNIYKEITEAYNQSYLDDLMVYCFKVFVKPDSVIEEQINILNISKKIMSDTITTIKKDTRYVWSKLTQEERELFVVNYLRQQGIEISDKNIIKEVIRSKPKKRKFGERPTNIMKKRVKNKK